MSAAEFGVTEPQRARETSTGLERHGDRMRVTVRGFTGTEQPEATPAWTRRKGPGEVGAKAAEMGSPEHRERSCPSMGQEAKRRWRVGRQMRDPESEDSKWD